MSKMKPRLWALLKTKLQQNLINFKLRHNMYQRYATYPSETCKLHGS
jgi:hypothetical protein